MSVVSRFGVLAFMITALVGVACKDDDHARAAGGRDLYQRHCASCHGEHGKGDGPVAGTLRTPPADLTQIAKRAGGEFDEARVTAIIDGRRSVAAHGPREMPVWGAVFDEELKDRAFHEYTTLLQSRVLMDYVRSIQER